jgi:hypothetical protein
VNPPNPPDIVVLVFYLGLGAYALWLARKLLWHRHQQVFWFAAGAIVIGIGGLIFTEAIARWPWAWSLAFDPTEVDKFEQQAACQTPRALGSALVVGPIMLLLFPVLLRNHTRPVVSLLGILLFGVCFSLFYISPIPEKVAPWVFPEEALKVPSHCGKAAP